MIDPLNLFCTKDQGDDKTVKPQDFGENQDENHSDEQPRLLGGTAHTSITNNADSITGSQAAQTNS